MALNWTLQKLGSPLLQMKTAPLQPRAHNEMHLASFLSIGKKMNEGH